MYAYSLKKKKNDITFWMIDKVKNGKECKKNYKNNNFILKIQSRLFSFFLSFFKQTFALK